MRHKGLTRTVSFRVSGKLLQALEERAESFGLSVGDYSRAVVQAHLENRELSNLNRSVEALIELQDRVGTFLANDLKDVRDELRALKKDFNRAVGREDS